ncbi:MAG: 50S ribosomal protein L15 [Leptospirales bacterium]|nr:50S ribosomal protein L15 [Leptospirales bacterium]
MAKKEILNYASLLPAKKKAKPARKSAASQVSLVPGSRKKKRRIGRGHSSGSGKTSGRGHKGQKARSGYSRKRGFEGGQMPIRMRLPKRGFRRPFVDIVQEVNLYRLEKSTVSGTVGPQELFAAGLIRDPLHRIKILGTGEIKKALKLTADAFSESARKKIEAAGGACTERELGAEQRAAKKKAAAAS